VPIPVLMYHSIAGSSTDAFAPYTVAPARFAAQLDALAESGYRTVTMSELMAGPAPGRRGPGSGEKVVALTFDDAFADFAEAALPLLAERAMTGTLYVPTAYVGGRSGWLREEGEADRPMLSWAALQDVAAAGIEIGGHSHSHAQLDLLSGSAVRSEIAACKSGLEDHLGRPVRSFAYPFGYSRKAVRRALAAAGFDHACAVRDLAYDRDDRWTVPRWTVTPDIDPAGLVRLLTRPRTAPDSVRSGLRTTASYGLRRAGLRKKDPVTRGQINPGGTAA
jgi:peptidoglycan/xylan/chitin deacetylase (PgdA/CDA1 family)